MSFKDHPVDDKELNAEETLTYQGTESLYSDDQTHRKLKVCSFGSVFFLMLILSTE